MTSEPLPAGLVLLKHMAHFNVDAATMVAALPEAWRSLPRLTVDLETGESARTACELDHWIEAERDLREQVRQHLEPVLEANPGFRIVYYGSCPVPLTMALGTMLKTWRAICVVPHHHVHRAWGLFPRDKPPARVLPLQIPTERDRTPGEAIIRVSTSHKIDPIPMREIGALVEIDVELALPDEDAFGELDEMLAVSRAFREALNAISDRYKGISRIHLFASVQPGMALLLGAQISETMHPPIQTYQYKRNRKNGQLHSPALLLNTQRPVARTK